MNDDEVSYMIGYLTHSQIIDAVTEKYVSASSMIDICEYMNKHYWGGYEGCIRYCKFFQEDKELAKMFKEWYMVADNLGHFDADDTIYNGTEDIQDTEKNFRNEYEKKVLLQLRKDKL
tara:strand:+ start:422 stop:775 length:354 start_codon:yes stop_codon:yes gene_type:complete